MSYRFYKNPKTKKHFYSNHQWMWNEIVKEIPSTSLKTIASLKFDVLFRKKNNISFLNVSNYCYACEWCKKKSGFGVVNNEQCREFCLLEFNGNQAYCLGGIYKNLCMNFEKDKRDIENIEKSVELAKQIRDLPMR